MTEVVEYRVMRDYKFDEESYNEVDDILNRELEMDDGSDAFEPVHTLKELMNDAAGTEVEWNEEYAPYDPVKYLSVFVLRGENGRALGQVGAMMTPEITYNGERMCYFIGIKKNEGVRGVSVSRELIPAVEEFALSLSARVLVVNPIGRMKRILSGMGFVMNDEKAMEFEIDPPSIYMLDTDTRMVKWL